MDCTYLCICGWDQSTFMTFAKLPCTLHLQAVYIFISSHYSKYYTPTTLWFGRFLHLQLPFAEFVKTLSLSLQNFLNTPIIYIFVTHCRSGDRSAGSASQPGSHGSLSHRRPHPTRNGLHLWQQLLWTVWTKLHSSQGKKYVQNIPKYLKLYNVHYYTFMLFIVLIFMASRYVIDCKVHELK